MQRYAAESQELRATPPVNITQATSALTSATTRLGAAGRLQIVGDRATLTLTNVTADGLRAWLNEARVAARARPVEMQLTRNGQTYSGNPRREPGGRAMITRRKPRRPWANSVATSTIWGDSTFAELQWEAKRSGGIKWAVGGIVLGLIVGLIAFAPAAWLAGWVQDATGGRVLLSAARGTIWSGSAYQC